MFTKRYSTLHNHSLIVYVLVLVTTQIRVKVHRVSGGSLANLLVVNGATQVTVTWPTAVHVITETPMFLLGTHTHAEQMLRDMSLSCFLSVKT